MRTLALAIVTLGTACAPCAPFLSNAPELCSQADGGLGAREYVGNGSGSASCTAGFDGGQAVFTLSGTSCVRGPQTSPVAFAVTAPCDVSAFPAGVYTATVPIAGGTSTVTFQLPTTRDGALPPCN